MASIEHLDPGIQDNCDCATIIVNEMVVRLNGPHVNYFKPLFTKCIEKMSSQQDMYR